MFRKASVVYFLSTTFARTCIAALCMCCPCVVAHVFATKLEWCHVPVRSGDVSTASLRRFQSSVRTALLQLSSDSMTLVFVAEQTTSRFSKIRPLCAVAGSLVTCICLGTVRASAVSGRNCSSIELSAPRTAFQVVNTALHVHRVALGVVQISSMLTYFSHAVHDVCGWLANVQQFPNGCSVHHLWTFVEFRKRFCRRHSASIQVSSRTASSVTDVLGFASTECPRGDRAVGSSAQRFAT